MVSINFTAKRFNSSTDSAILLPTITATDESEFESHVDKQLDIETLLDNEYFRITNSPLANLILESDEDILDAKANSADIATVITTKRILVYNYKLKKRRPYYFECTYMANAFNLLPLCVIIPNSVNELKPDLVVIDPVSGLLKFYETIKMEPSLGGLQNIRTFQIKVNTAEFLTDIKLFQHNDLILTTSQCRVLYVKLKDHLRDSPFSYFEIYNNRPLASFMLSKSYSFREYNNFNHIISLKIYNITPVEKLIAVLESSGRLTLIKHLIGSSTFSLEKKIETKLLLDVGEAEYLDFDLSPKKQLCVILAREGKSSPFFGIAMSLWETLRNDGNAFKIEIPFVSSGKNNNCPKIHFAKADEICVIESDNKVLLFEPQFDALDTAWTQLVTFKEKLEIFSIELLKNSVIVFNTNEGYICLEVKKSGTFNDQNIFMEQHIIQCLKFATASSSVVYNLKNTGVPFDQVVLKSAIRKVSDNLMSDGGLVIGTNANENLKMRQHFYLKLIGFASDNCDIDNDYNLKSELVTNCHLLSLSCGLYALTFEEKYADIAMDCLRSLGWDYDLKSFFVKKPGEILTLLGQFIINAINLCAQNNFLQLADSFSAFLHVSFNDCDLKIKKYINEIGLCKLFMKDCEFIKSVNLLTKKIYEMNKQMASDIFKARSEDILLKLTYYLYHVSSETQSSIRRAKEHYIFDDLNRFVENNKENWISVYSSTNKQSELIPLAILYDDMETLAMLIESRRESCLSLDDSTSNLLTEGNGAEFDYYFDHYGYSFAEALFKHYLATNKINVMLQCFPNRYELLERFLNSDIKFYKFGWIHDVQIAGFDRACSKLLVFMSDETYTQNNILEDMKLHSSIGKLSAVCSRRSSTDSPIERFSSSLQVITIQNELAAMLADINKTVPKNHKILLENLFSPKFDHMFWKIFKKINERTPLSFTEIINFVTMCSFESVSTQAKGLKDFEDFIVSMSTKMFSLLENFQTLDNKEKDKDVMRVLLIRLLTRRLVLRDDCTAVLSKVVNILKHDIVEGYLHDLSSLELQRQDLYSLGISEEDTINDYIKENEMLKNIELFKSL